MRNALSIWNRRNNPRSLFDWPVHGDFDAFFSPVLAESDLQRFTPACEVTEAKDRYSISLDLPGIAKDEIKVEVEDGVLKVSGHRKSESEEEKDGVIRSERSYGEFIRSFSLPDSIDAQKINATHKDGVLKISVPKSEKSLPKQIDVNIA